MSTGSSVDPLLYLLCLAQSRAWAVESLMSEDEWGHSGTGKASGLQCGNIAELHRLMDEQSWLRDLGGHT